MLFFKGRAIVLILIICAISITCICSCVYPINRLWGPGDVSMYLLPSSYDATAYALEYDDVIIQLNVYDDTTLTGWVKGNGKNINIIVRYELFGTGYEYSTAKIYNSDTNEYIDYVLIECDGQKLVLTSKSEEKYNPNILDGIRSEQSIFLICNSGSITLNKVS